MPCTVKLCERQLYSMLKVFTAALAAKGAHLLECPITGGLEALKKGQMAVWVGGDKGGVTQCCAVLS